MSSKPAPIALAVLLFAFGRAYADVPLGLSASFGAASIPLNTTTTLTFVISNSGNAQTNATFTDSFPAGLVLADTNVSDNGACFSKNISGAAGATSIGVTVGTVPGNALCSMTLNVMATSAGVKVNTTSTISSTEGGVGGTATATLNVDAPPSIAKSFVPNSSAVTGVSTLSFSITNPNSATALTGVSFTDVFPAGVQVASPPNVSTIGCGTPTYAPAAGDTTLTFSGATILAADLCTVTVSVTATTTGAKVNTTGSVTSTNGGTGNTGTDTLTVLASPTIANAFLPNQIAVNGLSTLSFTITNPNTGTAFTGVAFADTFPAGVQVAGTPGATTSGCGTPTFAPAGGNTSLSFSGATVAASGTCTVTINVTGTTAGTKINTTGNVTSTNGGTGNTATDTLTVIAPPTIAKSFLPTQIMQGAPSILTFTLTNPAANTVPLTGVGFTDVLNGMSVFTPNNLTGSCGGGTITAPAGSSSITLSGATLPVNGSCTFSVDVSSATLGTLTNTTGNVSSANGGTGNTASAQLTVTSTVIPTLSQWGLAVASILILLAAAAISWRRRA